MATTSHGEYRQVLDPAETCMYVNASSIQKVARDRPDDFRRFCGTQQWHSKAVLLSVLGVFAGSQQQVAHNK